MRELRSEFVTGGMMKHGGNGEDMDDNREETDKAESWMSLRKSVMFMNRTEHTQPTKSTIGERSA
jgi:hypothetical protein